MFPGEKIFQGSRPISYLHQKPESSSKYMIVVFSGFPSIGNPPTYNYVKTLADIDCHKLFILDNHNHTHSSGATYYLGVSGDHSVEMSVVALITKIANEHGVSHKNIICAGSSKGGFASLYFGIKYSFGHVISGGAQTKLGDYLAYQPGETKYILSFITGDFDRGREYLNHLLYDVVRSSIDIPQINIHVGRGDHHYKNHILPLTDVLDSMGISYQLDIGDYDEHAKLAEYYPGYLLDNVHRIFKYNS